MDINPDDPHSGTKDENQLLVQDTHPEEKGIDSTPKLSWRRAGHRKPRQSDPHSDLADYQPSCDESSEDGSDLTQNRKRPRLRAVSSQIKGEPAELSPVDLADTILAQEGKEIDPIADHVVPPTWLTKRKRQSRESGSFVNTPDEDGCEGGDEDEDEKPMGKKHRWKTATDEDKTQQPTSDTCEEGTKDSNDQSEAKPTSISDQSAANPPDLVSKLGYFWGSPRWRSSR